MDCLTNWTHIAQARCLASYIVNALNNYDVPSVASTILKLVSMHACTKI